MKNLKDVRIEKNAKNRGYNVTILKGYEFKGIIHLKHWTGPLVRNEKTGKYAMHYQGGMCAVNIDDNDYFILTESQ